MRKKHKLSLTVATVAERNAKEVMMSSIVGSGIQGNYGNDGNHPNRGKRRHNGNHDKEGRVTDCRKLAIVTFKSIQYQYKRFTT